MNLFRGLTAAALVLCAIVVVFGAYVRLSDAGLGCPDWPGCYGRLAVPTEAGSIASAQQQYPDRPLVHAKASTEMVHRYLASTLGLLIAGLALLSLRAGQPKILPRVLLALVVVQGLLGMWTVTWLLKPLVVTAHLLGGLATLALLCWLFLDSRAAAAEEVDDTAAGYLQQRARRERGYRNEREAHAAMSATPAAAPPRRHGLRLAAGAGLALLTAQVFLGGWTSSNYAALACPDLPTCQGRWWPQMDAKEAFTLWRGLGVNYEHGVLDNRARVTIHWLHRVGALAVSLFLVALGSWLWRRGGAGKPYGVALCALLTAQVAIGATMVLMQLPLPLAVAHNAGAALLLLTLVSLNHFAWRSGNL
jgi:cytochrome c oxidase assembly protein subunit 15